MVWAERPGWRSMMTTSDFVTASFLPGRAACSTAGNGTDRNRLAQCISPRDRGYNRVLSPEWLPVPMRPSSRSRSPRSRSGRGRRGRYRAVIVDVLARNCRAGRRRPKGILIVEEAAELRQRCWVRADHPASHNTAAHRIWPRPASPTTSMAAMPEQASTAAVAAFNRCLVSFSSSGYWGRCRRRGPGPCGGGRDASPLIVDVLHAVAAQAAAACRHD